MKDNLMLQLNAEKVHETKRNYDIKSTKNVDVSTLHNVISWSRSKIEKTV